ncbi:methyltransferase domain-containing protein [bacterium SCSIO 12741]|nr:methyltransferase domain-containing protein [bacterium SCSIO 12741]
MNPAQNISDYYNQTLVHYKRHWKLRQQQAIHYGIWYPDTRSFAESLQNSNRKVAELLDPRPEHRLLDAGCGVGGTARFLAKHFHCQVTGIALGSKLIEFANNLPETQELGNRVILEERNYLATGYPDYSFDGVYAVESMCHSDHKKDFLAEAYRLLKPGGKLIVIDYFLPNRDLTTKEASPINKWLGFWAIPNLVRKDEFEKLCYDVGFENVIMKDYTPHILRSAKRMYHGAILGAIPSELYNLFHPSASRFARKHYQSGYWQYKTLRQGLWNYQVVKIHKPK